jgi:hypothetical protein
LWRIYDVACELQIARNCIGDWHVHIDRFLRKARGSYRSRCRGSDHAPSPRYSGIAAAEVSKIRKEFDALRRKISNLTVTLTHPRPKSAPWFRRQMLWQFEFEFGRFLSRVFLR